MDEDFETVINSELELLTPGVRANDDAVRALLHEDFREFGASGTIWDRETVVHATRASSSTPIQADDLRPVRLGPDAILLTYTARMEDSTSLRTAIWIRADGAWKLRHHQGTRLPPGS
ncbi:DUF4440 domain-containing protein [Saccharopolyspora shandongensis]|uniref:DUF4440 domain-containing protein n=1 Tax=Saccharopolyspora shandongensis TaxID=418495 RepID=A0A1H2TML6_9PSEU|nr:DUF4440 domain-containing protein [Saccharopolyspora shandongensis]SDW45236.1 hypothetical protein SAMN05216215_1003159 [Saccharopolyspora shandongensis]